MDSAGECVSSPSDKRVNHGSNHTTDINVLMWTLLEHFTMNLKAFCNKKISFRFSENLNHSTEDI